MEAVDRSILGLLEQISKSSPAKTTAFSITSTVVVFDSRLQP